VILLSIHISQGSVVTRKGEVRIFVKDTIQYFLGNLTVKEYSESFNF